MRTIRHESRVIEAARRAAAAAETANQLRRSLAVLIPALAGVSLETTAEILGLSRSGLGQMRQQFLSGTDGSDADGGKRGGRRHALMPIEQERIFLRPWIERILQGDVLEISSLRAAYERAVGRPVAKSTVYRLLSRHGWSRDGFADAKKKIL